MMEKIGVILNKLRYIGAISKTVMYDFHYNYLIEKFPDCKLLFTGTDSFCFLFQMSKTLTKQLMMVKVKIFLTFQTILVDTLN